MISKGLREHHIRVINEATLIDIFKLIIVIN
jgi:hypothetical protein